MNTIIIRWLVCFLLGSVLLESASTRPATAGPLPNKSQEPAFQVKVNATDVRTKKPVKSIRIVPTSYNPRAKQITWQSQYLKEYDTLPAVFQMKRGWKQTLLRIEADGYRPFVTQPLPKETGIELAVTLEPDQGIVGRVLTPGGKSAKGATIAVCTWTNEVTVRDAALQYGHHADRLRGLVQTADDGSFRVPGEVDPWVLVVVHESGYAESTAAEFAKDATVKLKPWGRLEGEFTLGGKPMIGHPVNVGAGRGDVPVVLHYSTGEINTDAAGKFVVDRLPPVKLYVSPMFKHGDSHVNLLWFSGLVEIKPGTPTRISVPRAGQVVTGRLKLPEDGGMSLDELDIELTAYLRPPRMLGFGNQGNSQGAAYAAFMKSDEGRLFRRDKIPVSPDGGFHIDGLPETYYVLQAMAYRKPSDSAAERGKAVASYTQRVQLPAKTAGKEALDLGVLTLKLHPGS